MEPIDKLLLVEVEDKLFEFVAEAEYIGYILPTLERIGLMKNPLKIKSPSILQSFS
jgi:hypothetical protein